MGEGTHFIIPVLQKPYIFDVRTRPRSITSVTGTKGALFGALPYAWFRPSICQAAALLFLLFELPRLSF